MAFAAPAIRLPPTRLLKPAVFIASLVPLVYTAYAAYSDDLGANPIQSLEIRTGVWALRFVVLTLLITPLRRITHLNELVKYRRMLGLFAFFYATVHLSIYLGVDMAFNVSDITDDVLKRRYITVGMASWLMLVPLAVTSTKGWIRRMGGKRWNRLHRLTYLVAIGGGIHYLWGVKKDTFRPAAYLATFAVLLAYRAWVAASARQQSSASRAMRAA